MSLSRFTLTTRLIPGVLKTGTGAASAGLQVGDVLISVNGYLTEQRGNLAWIIAKVTPGSDVKMVVRTVKDGKDHTVMATVS